MAYYTWSRALSLDAGDAVSLGKILNRIVTANGPVFAYANSHQGSRGPPLAAVDHMP